MSLSGAGLLFCLLQRVLLAKLFTIPKIMSQVATRLVAFCLSKPKTIYFGLLLLTLLVGAQIPRIQIDTDPENMLQATHPARVFHNQVKQQFAMHDAIVVGVVNQLHAKGIYNPQSLAALHQLSSAILNMDGVIAADMMSLSRVDNIRQLGDGGLAFEWMMQHAPATQAQADDIQANIARLPLLYNTLVSADGKAAAIYVPIKDKNQSYALAEQMREQVAGLQGAANDNWHITGLPVAEDQFGFEMFVQMGIAAPLAGLTIFVLLFVFFRNFPLIYAPMIVAMATVIITMGALIGMGFTVHIMSSMIAIFLMPIAVVDSVHILSEFSDRHKPGQSVQQTIKTVVGHLFTPMLYTSVTSAVGFYSLLLTPIPPVKVFGFFVGTGILLAFVITMLFVPAYLSRLSDQNLQNIQKVMHREQQGRLARVVQGLGGLARSRATAILSLVVLVMAVSIWGIGKIQINDNPVRWFKADHEVRIADKQLNQHFAGTYDAYLVLSPTDGDEKSSLLTGMATVPVSLTDWLAETLTATQGRSLDEQINSLIIASADQSFTANNEEQQWLDAFIVHLEQKLAARKYFLQPKVLEYIAALQADLQMSGLVGKSNTLADVVKVVNRELRSGQPQDYRLPNSPQGVAQVLLQYQSSHRPQDLWHFVTPDYRASLLWLQLTSGDNQHMNQVVTRVADFVAKHPLPAGLELGWAGKAYLNVVWQDNMVAGMMNSLLSAFAIVFVMMMLLFRSVVFGVLAMLPLTITITFMYGLIGWVGKDYDMPIAVLSALTLGLSVDFAIHFLERARSLYQQTQSISDTLRQMFEEPANAISRNALVIALGFTPLLFAPLVPYITVGVFLASIMAVSALVTLLVLPALLLKGQRVIFSKTKGE